MGQYQKLCSYLDYFEERTKEKDVEDIEQLSYVRESTPYYISYSREMMNFAKACYEVEFIDFSYTHTLEAHQIHSVEGMEEKVEVADEPLLKAILTKIIREERFVAGAWIAYMKKNLFLKVLLRLKQLGLCEGSSIA
ncbi:DUF6508 domain-containing protein [Ornithinibacillus sp. 4-3]|uniref:DUF6508 domain-containing protein n=1 Tax=Ornithinibacillus sp. 4-3 TaxID=3231488 RepID=A0AB39HND2_9BACI